VNSWKVILATVVIFGAGVLTGGFLVNCVQHSWHDHRPANFMQHAQMEDRERDQPPHLPEPPLAERVGKQFLQQLDNKLQLTPDQHEKIEKIIADGQERNHEIWTNAAPKMRKVMQEVNQEIRAELKPEQQEKFEKLVRRYAPHHGTNAPPFFPRTNAPGD